MKKMMMILFGICAMAIFANSTVLMDKTICKMGILDDQFCFSCYDNPTVYYRISKDDKVSISLILEAYNNTKSISFYFNETLPTTVHDIYNSTFVSRTSYPFTSFIF
jgi:hypothetical protein